MQKEFQHLRDQIRAEIRSVFPVEFNLDRAQTAQLVGVSIGYLSNRESEGRPLIQPVKTGSKTQYQLTDIIEHLFQQRMRSLKRRGRPTKAEQILKQQASELCL